MIVFIHDNRIQQSGSKFYSNGSLTQKVLERHKILDNHIVYVTRKEKIKKLKNVIADRNDLTWLNSSISNFFSIVKLIRSANFVILRVPSFLSLIYYPFIRKHSLIVEVVGCSWDTFRYHSNVGRILAPFLFLFQKMVVFFSPNVHYVTQEFLQRRYPTRATKILAQSDVVLSEKLNINLKINRTVAKDQIIIGSIGSYTSEYKDFKSLILALKYYEESKNGSARLQLVGGGDSEHLREYANNAGVSHLVDFLGPLSHDRVFSWLNGIDLYIHPSKSEGCPRSLIEALSCNIVCFGSNVGGIPELLPKSALFDKGDYRKITELIIRSENVESRKQMLILQNESFIREKYHVDKVDANYLKFYNSIR